MKWFTTVLRSILFTIFILSVFHTKPLQSQDGIDGTKDWTILASYSIPGKASGLAWDGTFLYFGIYGSDGSNVHKFDPLTGQNELLFTNPAINDSYGMTFDGTDLWITDHGLSGSVPAYAVQLDLAGNILSQFDLPDHYMSGIAWDNGDFWVNTYYPNPGTIYKIDASGSILTQFQSPDEQPWDICVEGDNLWVADYDVNTLFKIDQTGNILESHASESIKPAGVVYDGQYLWYVDGQLSSPSTLYKVDLYGGGTPQIDVPVIAHNYGNVAVGDSATWNCTINNTGTADLEITNIVVQNAVPIFLWEVFPMTIPPGDYTEIGFIFKPTEPGPLNTIATIQSSDPVTPEVDLTLTGEAVYDGPHINVPYLTHDFGNVRINATTRWFLEIYNDGNQSLEISDINIDDPHFFLDESLSFPLNIGVLQTELIGIWFQPDNTGSFSGTATIDHNDISQGNIDVTLNGTGNDDEYPMGDMFWNFTINTSWDNSVKAIVPIQDVSGDEVGDVVVSSEDDNIRCFNGNSDGTADVLWEHDAGSVYGQTGLTIIEDINGDGNQDVIVGLAWGGRAVLALSGKTGEQLWIYDTHIYGDGGWVYQVWAALDYNEDEVPDVLASTGNDGNNTGPKRIFCLDGIDGSVIWDTYTNGPNFSCMGVPDFTGDGHPDAIGGASTNDESQGKVYGIDGSDGSVSWDFNPAGTSVWALEMLDDATGDGINDVIAGDFAGNYYLINAATGSEIESGFAGTSLFIRFERLDDVNANGYADIAFAYSGTNAIVVDGFDGNNIWLTGLEDKCWNIDRIEDVSGDGINDLVAGTLFSDNYCYFLDGVSGDELYSTNYNEAIDAIGAIPDINGDGSWEMVVGGRNGKLVCYSGGLESQLLQADFSADITSGLAPLTVQFTDLSSGTINSWEWDFENDGIIDAIEQNPEHTYNQQGNYSVSLVVSNDMFSDTLVKENYIIVDTAVSIRETSLAHSMIAKPNPFQNETVVLINSDSEEPVKCEIYNSTGRRITSLLSSAHSPGFQKIIWNGKDESGLKMDSGIYFVIAYQNGQTNTLKLILK